MKKTILKILSGISVIPLGLFCSLSVIEGGILFPILTAIMGIISGILLLYDHLISNPEALYIILKKEIEKEENNDLH